MGCAHVESIGPSTEPLSMQQVREMWDDKEPEAFTEQNLRWWKCDKPANYSTR